jgi:hypothetical protein
VEGVLASFVRQVFVSSNAGGLNYLRGDLLLLTGDEVDTVRELVAESVLSDAIEMELFFWYM